MSPDNTSRRVVVLQADRIHGEMIGSRIKAHWRNAEVHVFQRGGEALRSIMKSLPDLLITSLDTGGGGVFEHVETLPGDRPSILILVSAEDPCEFHRLSTLRCDGVFDVRHEDRHNLAFVLEEVMDHQLYVSASMVPHLKKRRTSRSKRRGRAFATCPRR